MSDTNALCKDHVFYQSNLMLNSKQRLALFRPTQTLSGHKNLHKHNHEIFWGILLIFGCIL